MSTTPTQLRNQVYAEISRAVNNGASIDQATEAVLRIHEQRPHELDEEQRSRLVSMFSSGFASGVLTYLVNIGSGHDRAQAMSSLLVGRMLDDPAIRLELTADLEQLWLTGKGRSSVRMMTAHHHHHPKDGQ